MAKKEKTRRKHTNADMIRSMGDEELAKFLHTMDQEMDVIPYCNEHGECDDLEDGEKIPEEMCIKCMLRWLQLEVSAI